MASSYLILYPDVPRSALVVTTSAAFDPDYPAVNTFYGERHAYGQLQTAATSVWITYDLGTGNSRTVDHFVLGGAAVLRANGVTQATLQGSSDGSTWVNQLGTASGFQTRTFDGPDDDDLIFTAAYNDQYAATLAAYRYWKVTLAGGSAHKFPVSKIAFGAALDLGAEPDFYDLEVLTEKDSDTWRYAHGHVLMTRAFYPTHRFLAEWDVVSDAKAIAVATTLLSDPYQDTVFLYAAAHADPLYDNRLCHCRVLDADCSVEKSNEKPVDGNAVRLAFEEMGA